MIPFNFHHLYYFYVVARTGSVSRAAEEVRVSQPALSAQIKQLERSLGESLFEREGRKLKLTETGRTAYAYAQTIFDAGREFMDHLRDRSQKGRLRIQIGATHSVPKAFSSALLRFVWKEDPSAHVSVQEDSLESLAEGLKNHALDLVLSDVPYAVSAQEPVENREIGKVPVVFCGVPTLVRGALPGALEGAPLILPAAQSGVHRAVTGYLAAHKVSPRILAEIQDAELAHRLALEGLGIVPLNRYSAVSAPWKGRLAMLPAGKGPGIYDSAYLITRKRKKIHPLVEKILAGFRIV